MTRPSGGRGGGQLYKLSENFRMGRSNSRENSDCVVARRDLRYGGDVMKVKIWTHAVIISGYIFGSQYAIGHSMMKKQYNDLTVSHGNGRGYEHLNFNQRLSLYRALAYDGHLKNLRSSFVEVQITAITDAKRPKSNKIQ